MASEESFTSFGFVGLGNMEINMAFNLSTYAKKQGLPKVRVWNRTPNKAQTLAEGHCLIASLLNKVASSCDIVHACFANDNVALSVYRQLFAAKKKGAIYVDHSTLFPTTSETLYDEAQRHEVHFLSCLVFGPPGVAKAASLLIALSGNEVA
jgi:3-hydroxyisobutyrate dehydrogenase-like beta-hydroxyacid dehydrogenase